MNREYALKQMIKYRDLEAVEIEEFEAFGDAWEFIADSEVLLSVEVPLVVASFFDKPHPEYLMPLEDMIIDAVQSEEDFFLFLDALLKNREGIMESCNVLYSMLHYHKQYISSFTEKMNMLKEANLIEFSWYFSKMKLFAITNRESFNEYLIPLEEEGVDVRQVVQDLYGYHKKYFRSFPQIMLDFKKGYPEEYARYLNEMKIFAQKCSDMHFLNLMAELD